MKAVVMAGGEGSRLRPITANRPKPLVPIGNRPIMEHIVELLKAHGVTEIVGTLHYLADEITSYFDDGSDFGVKMSYSIEDTPLGTAGSVKQAEALLKDETFFIISGDAMTDCDLTKALEFHKAKKSMATLILCRVPNPLEFGVVITDNDDKVIRFLEKPSWSEVFSDTVNTGIYILEPEIFEMMEMGRQYDWSQDIFPQLLKDDKPIYGYVMDDYWCDVGNLAQYREAQEHLLSGHTKLVVPGVLQSSGVWIGANSVIEEGANIIPPICIGRNCKIKRDTQIGPYTVIGDNSLIEEGAIIERSVIWDGAYIGPNVGIHSAIIGSRVTIKKDSVVQEDAVIGDRCLIDVGCTIRPRIKLWPDKVIERGSTVTMSLVWGHKWRGTLFRELGVAGLSNIEITPDFATRLGSAYGSTLPRGGSVVTGRDSSRSSRMIKRAIMASLLSVGCEVVDMRSTPVPVMRHYVRASGAAGAVNVRKLPGNRRVTLIEFFDQNGMYLSKNLERKVESAFFREDFNRVDPDDLGHIEFASRALEEYQSDFNRLTKPIPGGKQIKMVCDFGYSSISSVLPSTMARLGVDSINTNSFNDSRLTPRTAEDIARHIENLSQIVGTLGYDFGVLLYNEGERLALVDDKGRAVDGAELYALYGTLLARTTDNPTLAMPITGSSRLEEYLVNQKVKIIRTKADTRSLMSTGFNKKVNMAGDDHGGFIFPEFHAGFDAMYALARLINMLQKTGAPLSSIIDELPQFAMHTELVRCPWEIKGSVMRILAEQTQSDPGVELLDGIKVHQGNDWVLVIPDSVEPLFTVHAEAGTLEQSTALAQDFARRLETIQASL